MTRDQMLAHLRAADEVAREAAGHGHHPFGCVLVGPDDRILMRPATLTPCVTPRPSSVGVPQQPIRRISCGPAHWSIL